MDEQRRTDIVVYGGGYIGLVTAAGLAELGHQVWVREIDPAKVETLNAGHVPIYEPGLGELLERNRARLRFTTDLDVALASAAVAFVCVDTPPTASGDADLSRVWSVIDTLGRAPHLRILIMKSTVPPGTGARVRERLDAAELSRISYASVPEFTAEGRAVADWLAPHRIVVGADDPGTGELVAALHRGIEAPVAHMSVVSAEMVKLTANAALATRISFMNEIAGMCDLNGADVLDVAGAVGLDPRIGAQFLQAGLGWGGSCFPKDTSAFKNAAIGAGRHPQLLAAVIEVNNGAQRRPVVWLKERLGSLSGLRVALLGMTFKPGTDDMREAPSTVIAARLHSEGAHVTAWDPKARRIEDGPWASVDRFEDPLDALAGVDAAILVTDWPELRELDWEQAAEAMGRAVLFDGRNLLDPRTLRKIGFDYGCVGRP